MSQLVKLGLVAALALAAVAALVHAQQTPPSAQNGFTIPNPLGNGAEPLMESKANYFGLNIPYILKWQSQPYEGMKDLSSSLFRLELLNGYLFDLDHNRNRDPITGNLVGTFKIKALGMKLYDYADEIEHGNGWFKYKPTMPPMPTMDQLNQRLPQNMQMPQFNSDALRQFQTNAQNYLNNLPQYNAQQAAASLRAQMDSAFGRVPVSTV